MLTLRKADNPLEDTHLDTKRASRQKWFLPRPFAFGRKQVNGRNGNPAAVSISIANQSLDSLLAREWLLTNERGSYASSTIVGCNTRGYHGLLVGSLNPPVSRIMALANCLEMVIVKGLAFNLSTFEFDNKFAPAGFPLIKQFRQDIGAHFDYQLSNSPNSASRQVGQIEPDIEMTKSLYLLRDTDTVALLYDFTSVREPAELIIRPFVGLRDFHTLQQSHAPLYSRWFGDGLLIRHDVAHSCELLLSCPSTDFEKDQQWWFNFLYRSDKERGQRSFEDLWTPGFFKCRIESPTKIILWAHLGSPWERCGPEQMTNLDIDEVREDLRLYKEGIRSKVKSVFDTQCSRRKAFSGMRLSRNGNGVPGFEQLCLIADEFITKRQTNHREQNMPGRLSPDSQAAGDETRATIVAGYPWFADWGRDAFISLPGLLLSTGRFDEAKSVLTTFAAAADEGMIPNRFDDRNSTAHFNSVDASLWFINAAFQYLQASGDSETFMRELMPTIQWIIESYHKGTRFNIHADEDGLITAGDEQTQLTWMDAKYEGVAFTPRCGKAVEVNALWYNALCLLAQFYSERDKEQAEHYQSMAQKIQAGFCELFWNESKGYLNDCIWPDGSVDDSLRPNQIFAVSLAFSPLSEKQQKSVVNTVQNYLLTPYGLRTLNVQDSRYIGVYTGPQSQRDEAYHQGTVWAFLMGPFVEAYLKVNGFGRRSRKKAAKFIYPLLKHLNEAGCVGSVSEIFDGDPPHNPKGCIAQAWSVAELIRAYQLINSPR
ncbi:MAG: amylo-alpha-1,6-glucosidase [Phycisphaerales bacterium]